MAANANSGDDIEENLCINVNIHTRGILGILVKRIDTKGYQVRKVEDFSPFFTALKIGDIITHWDKIPLHNVSPDKYNILVEASQKNGKFALLLKRYTKQKPKDKDQEMNDRDEAGETQTETAPAPDLPSSVIATGKNGKDNAVLDKIEIASDQTMSEDTPPVQQMIDKIYAAGKDGTDNAVRDKIEIASDQTMSENTPPVQQMIDKIYAAGKDGNDNAVQDKIEIASDQTMSEDTPPVQQTINKTYAAGKDGNGNAVLDKIEIASDQTMSEDTPPVQQTIDKTSFHKSLKELNIISRREEKSNSTFNLHFEELKKFKKLHGHTNTTYMKDGALGRWCSNVRASYKCMKRGKPTGIRLDDDRVRRLEEIGFSFGRFRSQRHDTSFDDNLHELKRYKSIHGHCNVTAKNDGSIGVWAANIRSTHRSDQRGDNKRRKLGEDRIHQLQEIGFLFDQKMNNRDEGGETQTEMASVPDLSSPSGVTVAGKDGYDNAVLDRIDIAGAHTMSEDTPPIQQTIDKTSFHESLEELKQYKKQYGHVNVDKASNPKLYNWCASMRSLNRFPKPQPDAITTLETKPDNKGEGPAFNEYCIKELKELNFGWDPNKCDTRHISRREDISNSTFNLHFEELKKFKKLHGHTNPSAKNDGKIGRWCSNIKSSYKCMKQGTPAGIKLDDDRIRRLEEIGFVLERNSCARKSKRHDTSFDDNLHELKRYKSIHGHCNVTAKNDGRIGVWAANIRSSHRSRQRGDNKGMKLDKDRIHRLQEIGFLFNTESSSNECSQEQEKHGSHSDFRFDKNLKDLKAFKKKYGHCNPSINKHISYKTLASWCRNLKSAYKNLGQPPKGLRLDEDRIRRLEEIGFQWPIRKSASTSTSTNTANVESSDDTSTIVSHNSSVLPLAEIDTGEGSIEKGDNMSTIVRHNSSVRVRTTPRQALGVRLMKTDKYSGFEIVHLHKESPLAGTLNLGDILLNVNNNSLGALTQIECQQMIKKFTESGEEMCLHFSRSSNSSESKNRLKELSLRDTTTSVDCPPDRERELVLRRRLDNPMSSTQSSQKEIENGNGGLKPKALYLKSSSPEHKSIESIFLSNEVPNIDIKYLPVCHAFIVHDKESEAYADKMNKRIQLAAKKKNLGKRKIRIACKSAWTKKSPISTGISNDFAVGWTEEVYKKNSDGKEYKYWFSPVKKYKFRAKKGVLLFIEAVKKLNDEEKAYELIKNTIK